MQSSLRTKLKRFGISIQVFMVIMLLSVVAWANSLDSGIYTITNIVSHDNEVGQGMARSYTEMTSDIEVDGNNMYLSLAFNSTQYMGDFTIKVDGSQVSYDIVSNSNNIKKLRFKIPSLSSTVQVGLYVIPMDTNVEYRVTLNEGSLSLVKKAETVTPVATEEEDKPVEKSAPVQKTETSMISKKDSTETTTTAGTTQSTAQNTTQVTKEVESTSSAKVESTEQVNKCIEEAEVIKVEKGNITKEVKEGVTEEVAPEVEMTEEVELAEDIAINTEEKEKSAEEGKIESGSSITFLILLSVMVVIAIGGLIVYFKRK